MWSGSSRAASAVAGDVSEPVDELRLAQLGGPSESLPLVRPLEILALEPDHVRVERAVRLRMDVGVANVGSCPSSRRGDPRMESEPACRPGSSPALRCPRRAGSAWPSSRGSGSTGCRTHFPCGSSAGVGLGVMAWDGGAGRGARARRALMSTSLSGWQLWSRHTGGSDTKWRLRNRATHAQTRHPRARCHDRFAGRARPAIIADLEKFDRQISRSSTDNLSQPELACVCQDGGPRHVVRWPTVPHRPPHPVRPRPSESC